MGIEPTIKWELLVDFVRLIDLLIIFLTNTPLSIDCLHDNLTDYIQYSSSHSLHDSLLIYFDKPGFLPYPRALKSYSGFF